MFKTKKKILFGDKARVPYGTPPHLKNIKYQIKKILKRVYVKGSIRKYGAWLFGGKY